MIKVHRMKRNESVNCVTTSIFLNRAFWELLSLFPIIISSGFKEDKYKAGYPPAMIPVNRIMAIKPAYNPALR